MQRPQESSDFKMLYSNRLFGKLLVLLSVIVCGNALRVIAVVIEIVMRKKDQKSNFRHI
jgi:hypothetical protein